MRSNIPLFKIYWDETDVAMVTETIKRGMYWATGPNVEKFEKRIARYIGRKYAVVVNSGTSALHAVLAAYDIGKDDEIIVPSLTFQATANAVLFVGAKPPNAPHEPLGGLDQNHLRDLIIIGARIPFGGRLAPGRPPCDCWAFCFTVSARSTTLDARWFQSPVRSDMSPQFY